MANVSSSSAPWHHRAMRSWRCWFLGSVVLLVLGCTRPVPGVCCLDAADCASIGVSDPERPCTEGLACVNNACVVPSCSTDGCSAEAPVCDIGLDVCTGCMGLADCDQFDKQVCDTASGACVACLAANDCDAATPFCDANTCRGCRLDSECESGACDDETGGCVAESSSVYVSPTGTNQGDCSQAAPCATVVFVAGRTTSVRNHIVLLQGRYAQNAVLSSLVTQASFIFLHGGDSDFGDASLVDGTPLVDIQLPSLIRNLRIINQPNATSINVNTGTRVEHVRLENSGGFSVIGTATIVDSQILNPNEQGIRFTGTVTLDRITITGGTVGVESNIAGSMIDATNLMISRTSGLGINLPGSSGVLRFSTIADVGTDAGTGPRAVVCNAGLMVQSTIVWAPGNGTVRVAIGGGPSDCPRTSTIVGPTPVTGASNDDPRFVNPSSGDYHLGEGSPARDAIDTGPPFDFEGEARPKGSRFDLGADEF